MSATDISGLVGTVLPQSYNAGFIVLSYVISFIGAWSTLELLHRRTSGRGLNNWYVSAALCCAVLCCTTFADF
jgi:NO-binding membrane sensor protein with MHYT domain